MHKKRRPTGRLFCVSKNLFDTLCLYFQSFTKVLKMFDFNGASPGFSAHIPFLPGSQDSLLY